MNKFKLYIILATLAAYFFGYHVGRQDQALSDHFSCQEAIETAVQDTLAQF